MDLLIPRDPDLCLSNPDFPQKLPSGPLIKSCLFDPINHSGNVTAYWTPLPHNPSTPHRLAQWRTEHSRTVRFGLCRPLPGLLSLQPAREAQKICALGAHSPAHLSLELQLSPPVPLPLGLSLAPAVPPSLRPSPVPRRSRKELQPRPCLHTPRTPGAPPGGGGHRLLSAPRPPQRDRRLPTRLRGRLCPQGTTRVRKGNADRLLQALCSPLLTWGDQAAENGRTQKADTLVALLSHAAAPLGRRWWTPRSSLLVPTRVSRHCCGSLEFQLGSPGA